MDTKKYLDRIGFSREVRSDFETLAELQKCHLHSVPYENLDIVASKPLRLDIESLFEKIVLKNRGGYCFELNGLFGALLKELGFKTTDCMGRFVYKEESIPMRRHRVIKVELENFSCVCDVGVGMVSPQSPVKLIENEIQQIDSEQYKVTKEPFFGWVVHQCYEGKWERFYAFTEEPQLDIDYVMPSFYCENHPDSIFNKGDMVAICSPFGGKNSVSGENYTYWDENGRHKTVITNSEERKQAMKKWFNIDL